MASGRLATFAPRGDRGAGGPAGTNRQGPWAGNGKIGHEAAGNRPPPPGRPGQSACLRRKAGISISSIPLLARASTLAAAWARALRQTLGVFSPS